MDETLFIQSFADNADATVHHVTGSYYISACTGLGKRLLNEHFNGFVIENIARFINQPVLAVGCVGVKCYVTRNSQLREFFLEHTNDSWNQTVRIGGFATIRRFQMIFDCREKSDHRNAQINHFLSHFAKFIRRHSFNTRHGRNGLVTAFTFHDKNRQNQIRSRQRVFAH